MKLPILFCVALGSNALAIPPVIDWRLNMDDRFEGYLVVVPTDRPYWIEVIRTTTSNSGWKILTTPSEFGMPFFSRGTTLGFYDDMGALLFTNRQASITYAGSHIGLGFGYVPQFGAGSPNLPELNRHYYVGLAGVDRDFLPDYGFTAGIDSGRVVGSIIPSPSAAIVLLSLGAPLALRRRR